MGPPLRRTTPSRSSCRSRGARPSPRAPWRAGNLCYFPSTG